tara:strand:- start:32 stop:163 length:132 start_codon:yes stop_codon:yes gene_type:complete
MNGADLFLILAVLIICHVIFKDYKNQKYKKRKINIYNYKEVKK